MSTHKINLKSKKPGFNDTAYILSLVQRRQGLSVNCSQPIKTLKLVLFIFKIAYDEKLSEEAFEKKKKFPRFKQFQACYYICTVLVLN